MRRALLVAWMAVAVSVAAVGCGSTDVAVPAAIKAPPQTARLSWDEPYPAGEAALVFGVSTFTVTRTGWEADISVRNRSKVAWEIGGPDGAPARAFGVLLFPTGALEDLERRNREGDLPAIRPAQSFRPALPAVLKPGSTWAGTIAARGALAGGLWVRVSFGAFRSVGTPPDGAQPQVVWFTDHTHQLEAVAAEPA